MALVDSEAIAEIDYETEQSILYVRFVDGDWYSYLSVPSTVYSAFIAAESHGRFFQQFVRDRYQYCRGRL